MKYETYASLYDREIKKTSWYRRKAVRNRIKIVTIFFIACLITLASLAAYALLAPDSFLGKEGYHLIGKDGLKVLKTIGFAASAILIVLLIIYLYKSVFWLSHCIKEDKGFLYSIKESSGSVKGYLFGTIHKLPKGDQGLNEEICQKIVNSRMVFIECNIPEIRGLNRIVRAIMDGYLGIEPGVDFKIMNFANKEGISVVGFETMKEHEVMLTHFIKVLTRTPAKSRHLVQRLSTKKALDHLLVAWKIGNEKEVLQLVYELVGSENLKDWTDLKYLLKELSDDRNAKWMERLSKELLEPTENPIFIAVGAMHLFDFPTIETEGLISRLKNQGWKVTRIE